MTSESPKSAKGSPFRKKVSKSSAKLKSGDGIVCYGFPPTVYELYGYARNHKGEIKDGYIDPFRKFVDGDANHDYPHLEEAGFTAYYAMRKSPVSNERVVQSNGYFRYWLVRCVPEGNPSTPETRLEGLDVL